MDHAINDLLERMRSAIDLNHSIGLSQDDYKNEIQAYVKAINELERYYYGEPETTLESVLY